MCGWSESSECKSGMKRDDKPMGPLRRGWEIGSWRWETQRAEEAVLSKILVPETARDGNPEDALLTKSQKQRREPDTI